MQSTHHSLSPADLHGIIGILGFGVDGQGVAEYLLGKSGVSEVRVFDDRGSGQWSVVSTSTPLGAGGQKLTVGHTLDGVEILFRSPGFPLTHPLVTEAKAMGIPVTTSTAMLLSHCSARTVGITGSNGKTTCSTLIMKFLEAQYPGRVHEGGNDRRPRLDLLGDEGGMVEVSDIHGVTGQTSKVPMEELRGHFVVLELSSFQLIDCPASPNTAVVLNLTPNHLDWHKDMEEYAEAKRQIVAHQREGDTAILNPNDPIVRGFGKGARSTVRFFDEDIPFDQVLCKSHPDTIRAAVTAARVLGVSEENILSVLRTFPGVSHRIEFIRELDSVKWYNDSSCTTPESAMVACDLFEPGTLILLIGGRDKGMDFSGLYGKIAERNVRVVPYGEKGMDFRKDIPSQFQILSSKPMDFQSTIEAARGAAKPGDSIVLSPTCASFDMFKNAKERGKIFSEIVRGLS